MDIICAISTPAGVGGIAVLRLSGDSAKSLAESVLRRRNGSPAKLSDHRAVFCDLWGAEGVVDEVVATFFAAPHSYTGEDVVEIGCHGSLFVQQKILSIFVDAGARLAEPGEFTMRAFLNGRLDLSQAEAVADLIDSRSSSAHRLAISQLRGGYAKELETIRQQLVDLAALLELELDFSDEDLQFASRDRLYSLLDDLSGKVERLVASFQMGNALKNGVPVAIVGPPNAGKSTLLNTLLGDDRAIVSDLAGTTRDTIEEQFVVDGVMFRLIDTAGIRHTDDQIENEGIARALKAASLASIVLLIVSGETEEAEIRRQFDELSATLDKERQSLFLLINKTDIAHDAVLKAASCHDIASIPISAKSGVGIAELKEMMLSDVQKRLSANSVNDVVLTNMRHYEAMIHLLSALSEVRKGLDVGLTPDLLVVDLRDALYHLGTITGKVSSDEILSSIFSRFCVGK